jgi:hypothetical protein
MNGKQAKRLRKAAVGMAVHMVETGRTIQADQHVKPQPVQPVDDTFSSKPTGDVKRSETEVNRADSLRGIYRYLKKSAK